MISLNEYRITFEVSTSTQGYPEIREIPMSAKTLEDALDMFVEYIKTPEYKTIEIIAIERV